LAELYIFSPDDKLLTIITEETGLVSAWFREELNQVPDTPFSFTIEADSENAQYVVEENQVVFRDKEGEYRLYVIKELDDIDNIDGPQTKAICLPAFLVELKDHIIVDRRFIDKEAQEALNVALEGTRWTGEVEVSLGLNSTNFYYMTSVDAIWNILSIWGGEFKDAVKFDEKNNIVSRKIKILQRRGADRGKRFEIDHDIEEIQRTVLSYPVTALYGRGASLEILDEEGEHTGGYTRYIDFADVEWKKSKGDPVDKPKGQKWVGDPDALEKYGYLKKDGSKLHRFGIVENHDIEDPKELLEWTWQQLQKLKKPEVNYGLSVHLLEMLAGYEHEHVELGDTAAAIDRQFARPIEVQARVIAIEYDLVNIEDTAKVEMGQFLSAYQYDDTLDKVVETINNNRGKWEDKTVTNDSFPDIKPGTPVNVQAIGGFKTIQLYWEYDSNVYISHYEVYGSQVKDFVPDNQHLLWRGRVSSFSHEVNTDEVWYYRVRAVNTRGTPGDFSPEVSASTVRIISDDILFGEDIAAELRELSKTAKLLADGTIDLSMIGEDVTEEIESAKTIANDAMARANTATQQATDAINQAQTAFDEAQAALTTANNATDIATTAKTIAYESANQATSALTTANNAMDEAKKKADINSVYTKTEIDRALTGYASVTAVNTLTGRVDKAETAITQNANNIALKADKNVVDTLKNTVDNHSTLISQNADAIALKANQSTVDALTGRVSTTEATLTTHANQIAARITKTEADAKYATQTALTATANSLTSSITAVRSDLDNLEIGGRNLIPNSKIGAVHGYPTNPTWTMNGEWKRTTLPLTNVNEILENKKIPIEGDVEYTQSIMFRTDATSVNFNFTFFSDNTGHKTVTTKIEKISGELYRAVGTGKTNAGQTNIRVPDFNNISITGGTYIEFAYAKIEKGNRATDWTPAPEDMATVTQFNTLQQTLDSTTSRIGNAEGSISTLQQTASSLASRITNTEGNISTLTQTANGLQTRVSNNEKNISTVTQTANALQTRMTNAEGNISTLTATANSLTSSITAVRSDLDNLEIGGRNLAKNSTGDMGLNGWEAFNSGGSLTVEDGYGEHKAITRSITGSGGAIYTPFADVIPNDTYTLSFWVKTDKDATVSHLPKFRNASGTESNPIAAPNTQVTANTWTRITFTLTIPANQVRAATTPRVINGEYPVKLWVSQYKLEKGNRATDWTPAPEDMATQSQFTQLADAINLRVSKNDIINQINVSTEGILIAGQKIRITGQTTIDNAVIKTAHIADAAITSAKIANLAVGSAAIADGAITRAKLGTAAIGTAQIQDGAITNAKIANATIDDAKIASISANKITTGVLQGITLISDNNQGDRIVIEDGSLFSRKNNKNMIEMQNYNLIFYDSGTSDPTPDNAEVGRIANVWYTDNNELRGLALVGYKDFVSLNMGKSDTYSEQQLSIYRSGNEINANFYTKRVFHNGRDLARIGIDTPLQNKYGQLTGSPGLWFFVWENFKLGGYYGERGKNYAYGYGYYPITGVSKVYAVFAQIIGAYSDNLTTGIMDISNTGFTLYVTGTGATDVYNVSVDVLLMIVYQD